MSLALNKPKLDNLAGDIWKSAERLRGKFKAYEYQNVVLPIIVIRRLECVLIKWREDKAAEVLAKRPKLTGKDLAKLVKGLETSTAPFSNKTNWTLRKVYEEDHTLLEENFRAYINGFSKNVDDIIEHFNYRATIGQVVKNNRLAPILNQYKELELGPDKLSPLEMGYIYEELLRRFSEQTGEEAGEHFTPREVIRLMVELLDIPIPDRHMSIYDPACGTGGMLSVAKEHLLDRAATPQQKANVEKYVTVHGQELSPTNYAICQADLLIKNDQQAKVHLGNSLVPHDPHSKEPGDRLPESKFNFDFMLSNPPFGVTWGGKDGYEAEARKLETTRYRAGMPRVNDGALLFLQTMLAKMKDPDKGASRIAIIFNGSPLSNGDCGSGESEIRRWILENDWLDAIVMLPDELFYNTSIFTYVWLLRNDKPASHRGRVMLVDARQQYEKEPKAFGNKRNRMSKRISDIPAQDRPREKLLRKGAAALSDQELLAVLLGKGTLGMDVMKLAGKLAKVIDEKGLSVRAEDLIQYEGVGDAKAALIMAALEFARRRIKPDGAKIETPADLLPHVRHYADRKQEHVLCASINGANEIINIRVVSIGLIDRTPVHPREVFADALTDRASAIIVAHNHPAGSLEPSASDVEVTKQLKSAGIVMGIALLDHIIFNRSGYFSFLEAGRL